MKKTVKPWKFGNVKSRDCRVIAVRLPDSVIERLGELGRSNGQSATQYLEGVVLTITGMATASLTKGAS